MKSSVVVVVYLSVVTVVAIVVHTLLFRAPDTHGQQIVFTVPRNDDMFDVVGALDEVGFLTNKQAFSFVYTLLSVSDRVEEGGYYLSKSMNTWQILRKLSNTPDFVWVTISFCARKEQIGETLKDALHWSQSELDEWNMLYKDENTEYFEGVYYPDTYLLSTNETPEEIATRFIDRFNEAFAPVLDEFVAQDIQWTTGLKIASLIAREAAGPSDMPLVSGVIWNRLFENMPLQIDATMQYTLEKNKDGNWWGIVDLKEKQSDSPYNTYRYKGLPPTPICSPGIDAIKAVIYPEETDCNFYLHDKHKNIYCAKTYEEHLENIGKYL